MMLKIPKSDFRVGYEYARQHYETLGSPKNIFDLAIAFFSDKGVTAELSSGMGVFYLETAIKLAKEQLSRPDRKTPEREC